MTQDELASWRNEETTKAVLKIVQEELDQCVAHIAAGRVIGETTDATVQEVCRLAGMISGLSFIFEIEADEDEYSNGDANQ